jgi:hypothetical protein
VSTIQSAYDKSIKAADWESFHTTNLTTVDTTNCKANAATINPTKLAAIMSTYNTAIF